MRLANSIDNYDEVERQILMNQIRNLYAVLEETEATMTEEIANPSSPKEGDNVIHVNFMSFTQFERLRGEPVELHRLLDIYDQWNDTLWELAIQNKGHYKNPKVVEHLIKHRLLMGSLADFFNPPQQPATS